MKFIYNTLLFIFLMVFISNCDFIHGFAEMPGEMGYRIYVIDSSGSDLLNPNSSNRYDTSQLKIYEFIGSVKGKQSNDYYTLHNRHTQEYPNQRCYLRIIGTPSLFDKFENQIIIQWSENQSDTIRTISNYPKDRTGPNLIAIYVNGKETSSFKLTKNIDTGELY